MLSVNNKYWADIHLVNHCFSGERQQLRRSGEMINDVDCRGLGEGQKRMINWTMKKRTTWLLNEREW